MSYYSTTQYKPKADIWFERFYFERFFKDSHGPILDVGCATGNVIATHPDIIEGIEVDEDSLTICRERGFRVRKVNVENELEQMPSDHYQGIYVKQVIEHLREPLYFFKHTHRMLAPGGKAVMLTPNCPYALNRFFWDDYTHQRPFTKESLRRIALDAGFTKIKIYTDFRCFPGLGRLIRISHISPQTLSALQRLFFIQGLSLIIELEK